MTLSALPPSPPADTPSVGLSGWRRLIETINQLIRAPKWTAPTLLNSWVNFGFDGVSFTYNPAGYYIDATGRVWLRGLLKSGTLNTAFFTLPAGFRPAYEHLFVGYSSAGAYRLDARADGTVTAVQASAATFFSIDGISFSTSQ